MIYDKVFYDQDGLVLIWKQLPGIWLDFNNIQMWHILANRLCL